MRCMFTAAVLAAIIPAAYAAPGDIDQTFGSNGATVVGIDVATPFADFLVDTVTAPNGDIYLIGSATSHGNRTGIAITRLNPDGTTDLTYGNAGTAHISDLGFDLLPAAGIVDNGGNLLIAATGLAAPIHGTDAFICKLTPTGNKVQLDAPEIGNIEGCIDDSFRSNGWDDFDSVQANAIVLGDKGRILVLSTAVATDGRQVAVVDKLMDDAKGWDNSFGQGGFASISLPNRNTVGADIILSGSRILVGASTAPVNSNNFDFMAARLQFSGEIDPLFGDGMTPGIVRVPVDIGGNRSDMLSRIKAAPNGTGFILAGTSRIDASSRQFSVAKISIFGDVDLSFGQGGKIMHIFCDVCLQAPLADMTIQRDGKIVLVGTAKGDFFEDFGVMRLLSKGNVDNTFGAQGRVFVGFDTMDGENVGGPAKSLGASVSLQNGNIIVGGSTQVDANNLSNRDYAVVRLLAN